MMSFTNCTAAAWRLGLAAALTAGAAGAQTTTGTPPTGTTMPAAGGAMATKQGESPAEMFTDAKIAAVGSASNQSEIQTSQVALERAQHGQVKQYAQRMIAEHQKVEQQMLQLAQAKGVTPEDNAFSYQLKQNLPPMLQELRGKSGREFDKSYMLHQIGSHMTTLHALDTSLIPNARDPQLKTMLQQQVRPAVAAHYVEAQRLLDQVMRGASASAAPAGH